ncbi:MAG: hypothetical protein J6C93_04620 [Clostridia bacterium]|nr:hypothetical protein [Clostridia bacterium]
MKSGIVKYVNVVKSFFRLFTVVCIPAFMVLLVVAFNAEEKADKLLFGFLAGGVLLLFFIVYGFYSMRVTMGTVMEVQWTDQVVHLKTPRKTYTYDVVGGCVDMKVTGRKFVGTFETQDSRDKFIFYRRAPFSAYREEQFTVNEIRAFYPKIDEIAY